MDESYKIKQLKSSESPPGGCSSLLGVMVFLLAAGMSKNSVNLALARRALGQAKRR